MVQCKSENQEEIESSIPTHTWLHSQENMKDTVERNHVESRTVSPIHPIEQFDKIAHTSRIQRNRRVEEVIDRGKGDSRIGCQTRLFHS